MRAKQIIENNILGFLVLACMYNLLLHSEHIAKDIQGDHLWRQSQTMLNIRNFTRHDANILNPRVAKFNSGDNLYRYEFPLMQWTIGMMQRVTGESVILVRLMMFLFSSLGVFGMYFLIAAITREKIVGLIVASIFQFSPVIFLYSINPIPDTLALSCAIWYLYWILQYRENESLASLVWASIALSIATLVKLPYLMFSIVSILFFFQKLWKSKKLNFTIVQFVLVQFIILLPAFVWYAWVIPTWTGNPVVKGIFSDSVEWADTKKYFLNHVQVMFPKRLIHVPFWPFVLLGIYRLWKSSIKKDWFYALIGITLFYLFFEFHAITDVHDYYMFPFLPWIFVIVGFGIKVFFETKIRWLTLIFLPLIIVLGINIENIVKAGWNKENSQVHMDYYKYQDALINIVPRDEKVIIVSDFTNFLIPFVIDKQGNIFDGETIPIGFIDDMIRRQKFRYIYSNAEKLNNDPAFQAYVDTLMLDAGSVKVYRLKLPEAN